MTPAPPPFGPPQPPEEPSSYPPVQQYPTPVPPPGPQGSSRSAGGRSGLLGGLAALFALLASKFAYVLAIGKTLLTLLISFGAYALFFNVNFAAGLVIMILIHEMGHVIEIRRQGMQASAPLFIPFFGAAIFQRSHPTDALKQAQIGIAGPLAGSVAATVAFVLYGSTHNSMLLVWAYIGFLINLFNLIPVGMLDGGWIMAVVSKWFQVVGLGLVVVAVFVFQLSPILLIIVLMGLPIVIERFRYDQSPYFQSVPVAARYAMGATWLVLAVFLAFAFIQTNDLLHAMTNPTALR
jgi:Zn-dependent protease